MNISRDLSGVNLPLTASSVILECFECFTTIDRKHGLPAEEVNQQSRAVARAVRYLPNIEEFCQIYSNRLLSRLLIEKSESLSLEVMIFQEMAEVRSGYTAFNTSENKSSAFFRMQSISNRAAKRELF